ncbi:MAG: NAD(P)H-dependent flavin oxidoreductase [Geminicoccaceae bacterium]
MTATPRLDALSAAARTLLGCPKPILGGAMTWVSERNLVSAISEAGGFGVIACGAMDPARLAEEIRATKTLTGKPFGVNLIVMHPQLDDLIDVCLELDVGHIVLAGGLPPKASMRRVREGGARLLAFAPSLGVARMLIKAGADGLIIEGSEAGGHIGPVSTSVLAQEILPACRDVPVFVAGGIGHGEAVAAYMNMGAAGCQLGTAFVCANESIAHEAFKKAFIKASARDAVVSVQIDPEFRVIPVRALANDASKRFVETQIDVIRRYRAGEISHEEASLAIEHFWAGALRRAAVDGDIEQGSLMAGQSVGLVKEIRPVRAIIDDICQQAEVALARTTRETIEAIA